MDAETAAPRDGAVFHHQDGRQGHRARAEPGVIGFAKQSGGELTIDSVPGRGTTVRLTLPCCARPIEARHRDGRADR